MPQKMSEWQIESEWKAAGAPRDAKVRVKIELTDASRQGRASVTSCAPPVTGRQSQGQSQSPRADAKSSRREQPRAAESGPVAKSSRRERCRSAVVIRQPPTAKHGPGAPARRPGQAPQRAQSPRRAAAARATHCFAEDEVIRAVDRFQPFLRVAAVRVEAPQPHRRPSPDPYGF